MTRRIFFMFMLLLVSVMTNSQTMQEVVYLKNGSVIRGVVIEQVPNELLKIQTADGSVYVYQMDEVERITKEAAVKSDRTKSKYFTGYQGLQRGLRFFADYRQGYGAADNGSSSKGGAISLGYQIFPQLFTGVGVGVNKLRHGSDGFWDWDKWKVPLFIQIRSEFIKSPISPFLDVRFGFSGNDASELYAEPSLGCRFAVGKNVGVSVSAGIIGQRLNNSNMSLGHDYDDEESVWTASVFWKIGFDYNLPLRRK